MRVLVLACLLFFSCKTSKVGTEVGGNYPTPPNGIPIAENFFVDETEISNSNYQEYHYWIRRVFGADSEEFKATFPDTTVWSEIDGLSFLSKDYHKIQKFWDNPVVGITLKQAKAYSKWRSDRVAEMILVEMKVMELNTKQNRHNHFTIENFLSGDFKYIYGKKKIDKATFEFLYPVFKVPSAEEWELFSAVNSDNLADIFPKNKHNKSVFKKYPYPFNTIEFQKSNFNSFSSSDGTLNIKVVTAPVNTFGRNQYGLYGIIGNVSEMIEEEGFSKGENWNSSFHDFSKEKNNEFLKPNCWTGFRNVCRWETRKFEKKY